GHVRLLNLSFSGSCLQGRALAGHTGSREPPSRKRRRGQGEPAKFPSFPNSGLGTPVCETPFRALTPIDPKQAFRKRPFPNRSLGARSTAHGRGGGAGGAGRRHWGIIPFSANSPLPAGAGTLY